MATTSSRTDLSVGLGLLFSIIALLASAATAVFGYSNAVEHARALQVNGGIAFGVAMAAAALAIIAIHAYDN